MDNVKKSLYCNVPVHPTATTATAIKFIVYEVGTANSSHQISEITTKFSVITETRYPEVKKYNSFSEAYHMKYIVGALSRLEC